MHLVKFLRSWGSYVEGDTLFVPPDLFAQMVGNGVAEAADEAPAAPVVERAVEKPKVETADLKK